jgi:hypothetical protein
MLMQHCIRLCCCICCCNVAWKQQRSEVRRTCGGSRPASTPATVSCCSAELRPRMISRDRSTKPSQLPSKGLSASGGGGGEGEGGVGQERRLLCRRRAVAEGGGGGELAALPVPPLTV